MSAAVIAVELWLSADFSVQAQHDPLFDSGTQRNALRKERCNF